MFLLTGGGNEKRRGLMVGLGCSAAALMILLVSLGIYFWPCHKRIAARKAAPFIEKKVPLGEGVDNPAYVVSAQAYEGVTTPPPEYRSQVSLQGWVGENTTTDDKAPLPVGDIATA